MDTGAELCGRQNCNLGARLNWGGGISRLGIYGYHRYHIYGILSAILHFMLPPLMVCCRNNWDIVTTLPISVSCNVNVMQSEKTRCGLYYRHPFFWENRTKHRFTSDRTAVTDQRKDSTQLYGTGRAYWIFSEEHGQFTVSGSH